MHGIIYCIVHHTSDHSADSAANTCHSTKTYAHICKLTYSLVSCNIVRNVKASFLLICIALLRSLLRQSLRFYNHLLRFRLLVYNTNLVEGLHT